MKATIIAALLVQFFISPLLSQEKKPEDNYKRLEEKYQKLKDSSSELHPLIPAVSAIVLHCDQIEVNLFTSLISATRYRNESGNLMDLGMRQSYFYSTIQLTYGLSKSGRFNAGVDLNSIIGRLDQDKNSSILKVFNSQVEGGSRYTKAITSFSPRIRWRPLKRNYNFTIQNSLIVPVPANTQQESVLGKGQYYFSTQLLYNQPLTKQLFLFSQIGLNYGIKNGNLPATFYSPVAIYFSYLIPRRIIIFTLCNYLPVFSTQNGQHYYRSTFQAGGGVQYQLSKLLTINGYYANDIAGKNYSDFNTYSISLRFTTR
ncbi:MAG: hypothetical protein QM768_12930 [Agriterribacter sp.]